MSQHNTPIFPLLLVRTAGLPLQWPSCSNEEMAVLHTSFYELSNQFQSAASLVKTVFEQEKDFLLPDTRLQKIITNTRRHLRQETFDKSIIVDPYFREKRPDLARLFDDLNEKITNKQFIVNQLQEKFTALVIAERKALIQYAGHETICRSLLFTSHSLLGELPDLADSNPENWHKKERRTALSLLHYLTRASTKTTPLSRLATVHLQYLDRPKTETDEQPPVFSTNKHIVTPNVALLPGLYDVLLREPAFFNTLDIRLNPGLQSTDNGFEWLHHDGTQERFQLHGATAALQSISAFFERQQQDLRFCDLITALAKETEDSQEDIYRYVFQLIDHGLVEWVWPEKGFSPGWCGSLYNYLGFLPASAMLTDAAYLLQWLRTAARSISFQSVSEARETQCEALAQCRTFFERYDGVCPITSPEHVFYEDVEAPAQGHLPVEVVQKVTHDLSKAIKNAAPYSITGLRAALILFGRQMLQTGESMPFLTFCRLFLEQKDRNKPAQVLENHINLEKTGALLQFYKTSSGEYRAVLNALYPGGGKMMARWLHLFPAGVREQLQDWWPDETFAFPWQDWNNANFQPIFAHEALEVPGGRGAGNIALRDLLIFRDADALQLREKTNNRQIVFSDLGLEAPNERPPVIQILWQLGVPFVSAGIFAQNADRIILQNGVLWRNRIEYQSLVLERANWWVAPHVWQNLVTDSLKDDPERFISTRNTLSEWGVPRFFFAGFNNDKTRFFDQNSPLLMLDFIKMLQQQRSEDLYLSEMLPEPDQWIVEAEGSKRAAEWVLEWKNVIL